MKTRTEPSWRERARAMKNADPMLSNGEIGRRLGVTRSAVSKALNPERAHEWDRRSNAKRHEAKLAWQRQKDHSEEGRARCPNCGGPMGAGSARTSRDLQMCQSCISAGHEELWRRIEEMWNAGMLFSAICAELGWAQGTLSSQIGRMREAGRNIPHRRTPEQVARIVAGRWGHTNGSNRERS